MGKAKSTTKRLLQCFQEELSAKFAGLTFTPIVDPEDGNDAWLYVYVPSDVLSEEEVRDAAESIEDRYWKQDAISIVPMIRKQKEPVHG